MFNRVAVVELLTMKELAEREFRGSDLCACVESG